MRKLSWSKHPGDAKFVTLRCLFDECVLQGDCDFSKIHDVKFACKCSFDAVISTAVVLWCFLVPHTIVSSLFCPWCWVAVLHGIFLSKLSHMFVPISWQMSLASAVWSRNFCTDTCCNKRWCKGVVRLSKQTAAERAPGEW